MPFSSALVFLKTLDIERFKTLKLNFWIQKSETNSWNISRGIDSFWKNREKKFLVLINPVSGKGKAKDIWGQVYEMLSGVERDFEIVITERAGQAMEMTRDLDISRYAGVVTVSGDGGLYEVINGLYLRPDWPGVNENIRVGIVPGGSGHAVHCSLLHHQKENFSSELEVAALSLAHDNSLHHDTVECQTKNKRFISVFGVAWGAIPEIDLKSEFLRFLGPNRAWITAVWKWIFPSLISGTVYYLPFSKDSQTVKLPHIDDPLPPTWKALQGPFFNVYACKQPWLDYQMYFCPDAMPDDGKLWLVVQGALY